MKNVFKHFRQVDEIVERVSECVQVQVDTDGEITKKADSGKLSTLIEFMKSYPLMQVKRDKNSSSGMNYVMASPKDKPAASSQETQQQSASISELDYVK